VDSTWTAVTCQGKDLTLFFGCNLITNAVFIDQPSKQHRPSKVWRMRALQAASVESWIGNAGAGRAKTTIIVYGAVISLMPLHGSSRRPALSILLERSGPHVLMSTKLNDAHLHAVSSSSSPFTMHVQARHADSHFPCTQTTRANVSDCILPEQYLRYIYYVTNVRRRRLRGRKGPFVLHASTKGDVVSPLTSQSH